MDADIHICIRALLLRAQLKYTPYDHEWFRNLLHPKIYFSLFINSLRVQVVCAVLNVIKYVLDVSPINLI